MKLTFKRREVKDLHQLATLVAENAEAIEPGLQIVGSNLNLGRASVELVGIDSAQRPVLITLGLTADDAVLLRALEAYAWCLEYPEAVQKVVPATTQPEWPPRVVFVAERLLESFVRKMRLLRFSAVDFFEFRYVEAHGTTGFYLDRVDWDRTEWSSPEIAERPARLIHQVVEQPIVEEPIVRHDEPKVVPLAEPIVVPPDEPEVVPRDEPKIVMLHEPKAAPGIVEPAATNGAGSRESAENKARAPGERPPRSTDSARGPAFRGGPRDLPAGGRSRRGLRRVPRRDGGVNGEAAEHLQGADPSGQRRARAAMAEVPRPSSAGRDEDRGRARIPAARVPNVLGLRLLRFPAQRAGLPAPGQPGQGHAADHHDRGVLRYPPGSRDPRVDRKASTRPRDAAGGASMAARRSIPGPQSKKPRRHPPRPVTVPT